MATVPDYEDRWIEDRLEARQRRVTEGALIGFILGVLFGCLATAVGLGIAYASWGTPVFRSPLSDTILRNAVGTDNYRVAVTGEVRDDRERGGHRLIEDLARGCRHHATFHLAPHADGRDAALLSRLSSDHRHVTIDGWLGSADGRNEVEIISITPDRKVSVP